MDRDLWATNFWPKHGKPIMVVNGLPMGGRDLPGPPRNRSRVP